jgi:hypothetical protein
MTENMEADPFNISLRKFLKQVGSRRSMLSSAQSRQAACAGRGG